MARLQEHFAEPQMGLAIAPVGRARRGELTLCRVELAEWVSAGRRGCDTYSGMGRVAVVIGDADRGHSCF